LKENHSEKLTGKYEMLWMMWATLILRFKVNVQEQMLIEPPPYPMSDYFTVVESGRKALRALEHQDDSMGLPILDTWEERVKCTFEQQKEAYERNLELIASYQRTLKINKSCDRAYENVVSHGLAVQVSDQIDIDHASSEEEEEED